MYYVYTYTRGPRGQGYFTGYIIPEINIMYIYIIKCI